MRCSVTNRLCLLLSVVALNACAGSPPNTQGFERQAGQGQYIYPEHLRPQPTRFNPRMDVCGAQLYQGLVGQTIGGVHLPVIAGDKRIIKPAVVEIERDDFLPSFNPDPPLLEVREMLAGQPLYASSIRTGVYPGQLGPEREDRLSIRLDAAGIIRFIECG